MLTLGGLVFGLRAAGQQVGWGFQLQTPWVLVSLATLFTLIALNLWGIFEVGSQVQSLAGNFQSRHAWLDSFGSGVLAVAVASPCTAPFMGASVGLAFGLPVWQGLGIFASLGLGLSLPILLLGLVPQTAGFIPKPGPWMDKLRKALGFPMLATENINSELSTAKKTIIDLIDRIRMLDNDLIRLEQKINTSIELQRGSTTPSASPGKDIPNDETPNPTPTPTPIQQPPASN